MGESEDQECLAEREGFEPPIPVKVYTLSKRAPSATRPSLPRSRCEFHYIGSWWRHCPLCWGPRCGILPCSILKKLAMIKRLAMAAWLVLSTLCLGQNDSRPRAREVGIKVGVLP